MADIRINSLPTTASASSSDDFLALDGATNGTRKLNAYSPTFGGNLTVNGGTGTIDATGGTASATLNLVGRSSGTAKTASVLANSAGSLVLGAEGAGSSLTIAANTGNTTVAYNLTVSGTSTSSFAGVAQFAATKGVTFNSSTDVGTYGIGFKNDGSVYPIRVALANDAITQRRFQVGYYSTDTQAGTWTNSFEVNGYNGNTTIGGNLTVSGTGTSSFASGSKLGVGTTSPGVTFVAVGAPATLNYTIGSTSLADIRSTSAAATNAGPSLTFSGYYQTSLNTSTYGAIKGVLEGAGDGNSAAGALTFLTANTGGVLSEKARLTNTGNFLVGTTIDGGQKLQVSGTGYFSGNVGIGATSGTGRLTVYGGQTEWGATSSLGFLGYTGGNPIVGSLGALSLLIYTNGTEAARFDSSQNATFAGKATATRLIANSQWVAASAGTGALSATANAGVQLTGTGAVNDITLVNKNGDNVMVVPTGTTNATFAGAIAIGNTVQTAAGVSSTHKVTISIGGSTYYLLATNV